MKVIAHILTDMPEKFGIPRQSNLVKDLYGKIIFEKEYRSPDAIKGLEAFSYLWLLWRFDVKAGDSFCATVRPPRLGGNETMGVFATRSPFRPNPIGLSSVKLEKIKYTADGPEIIVSGVDLRNNTAIYDIKPYLAYVDSHPDAGNGFAPEEASIKLKVNIEPALLMLIPKSKQNALIGLLSEDPRPGYQNDEREYGLSYAGFNVRFFVSDSILTVTAIEQLH